MIKLLVLDLDGTLLHDGEWAQNSVERLLTIQSNGTRIMLATGRNFADASKFEKELKIREHCGVVAYSDGQYVRDYGDNTFVEFDFLDFPSDVKRIVGFFDARDPIMLFGKNGDYKVFSSRFSVKYLKALVRNLIVPQKSNLLLMNQKETVAGIDKVGIAACNEKPDLDAVRGHYEVAFDHAKKRYEIKCKGVNKGNAVGYIQNKYHLSDLEIAVFGNDENDISMFERYSKSYVVETASEFVKSKASRIIKTKNGKPDVMGEIENLLKEG